MRKREALALRYDVDATIFARCRLQQSNFRRRSLCALRTVLARLSAVAQR